MTANPSEMSIAVPKGEGVYDVQEWAEVHRLFHREGYSKRAIAKKTGMSRNTVDRLLELVVPPRYERSAKGSLLDPFREEVLSLLDEDPARPATAISRELRRVGYTGGLTILRTYLREIRPTFLATQAYQRTTYVPGEIMQVDWWKPSPPYLVPVGRGERRRAFGLVATLPYSAAHACVFTHAMTMADFRPALLGCLVRLGGVPRHLVVDNDSSIVRILPGRPGRPHHEVSALLGALRLKAIVLAPRRPTSKGQVERTVGYIEGSFWPRRIESLADLQTQADTWALEEAYTRVHRRVGGKVRDAFEREVTALAVLPDPLPDTDLRFECRVGKDAYIRVAGSDYSVPPGLVSRRVQVRLSPTALIVSHEGREVRRHGRSFVRHDVRRHPEDERLLRLAQEARGRLERGDRPLDTPDLARYDALLGVTL